jgi:plastocyanin
MRKIATLLTLALAMGLLVPGAAQGRQGEEEVQSVTGTIMFPTRFTSYSVPPNPDTTRAELENGWPGLVRRGYVAAAASNGVIGYVFPVDSATWLGRFELAVNSEAATPDGVDKADLGIYFYSHLGDAAGQATPVTVAEYERRALGGEEGFIPPGSNYGIVFMSRGANVAFSYTGYMPMAVEVTDTGYRAADITVKAGAWVVWENISQNYHSVTGTGTKPAFDSSPKANQPIIAGGSFVHRFTQVGDFPYFDRYGTATGVVHVVPGPGEGTPAE